MEERAVPGDPDSVFHCLADSRRRHALCCLRRRSNPTPVAELATEIAARERDRAASDVTTDAVRRVHVALHHVHLPALEDAGLVELDGERSRVVPTDDARVAGELLSQLSDEADTS